MLSVAPVKTLEDTLYQVLPPECVNHIYVIDDDLELRRSLHFLLSAVGFVSWPFSCAADFLDDLSILKPAPILLDIRMPDINGIELMSMLVNRGIKWPVITMTAHADIAVAVKATRLGAIEFLEKPFEFETLETALRSALETLSSVQLGEETRYRAQGLFNSLSSRELQVILVLMEGLSNKMAGHRLSISVRTIEMHRANALLKLKVSRIAEVIQLARSADLTL